jgi:hypothetical protein
MDKVVAQPANIPAKARGKYAAFQTAGSVTLPKHDKIVYDSSARVHSANAARPSNF